MTSQSFDHCGQGQPLAGAVKQKGGKRMTVIYLCGRAVVVFGPIRLMAEKAGELTLGEIVRLSEKR